MNSLPSPHPSIAPGSEKSSASRAARAQPTVWDLPSQQPSSTSSSSSTRRGLTPLSTNPTSTSAPGLSGRRATASASPAPQNQPASPLGTTFSSVLTSSNRLGSVRNPSSGSSTPSPWSLFQAGSQSSSSSHPGQSLTSPRARTTAASSLLASSTASANPSQGGGGGGGTGVGGVSGTSRAGGTFSPPSSGTNISSPTGFASDKPSTFGSVNASSASGQSSLSKISVAQVLLLLDSISEKEGKAKWESKADQVRKVADPHTHTNVQIAHISLS
jgi:CCR4-NOT transcription complex subunit 1